MANSTALRHPTFLDLILPARGASRLAFDVIAILAASLFVAAAAQVSVPTPWGIPFTCSDIAAVLVGIALGPWRGAAALTVYMIEGVSGLPVFSGGYAGLPPLTFGYILGFIPAAFIAGWLAQRGWDRSRVRLAIAMATAQIVIYIAGIAWAGLLAPADLRPQGSLLMWGVVPFLPAAAVKIAIAVALVPAAWKAIGRTR